MVIRSNSGFSIESRQWAQSLIALLPKDTSSENQPLALLSRELAVLLEKFQESHEIAYALTDQSQTKIAIAVTPELYDLMSANVLDVDPVNLGRAKTLKRSTKLFSFIQRPINTFTKLPVNKHLSDILKHLFQMRPAGYINASRSEGRKKLLVGSIMSIPAYEIRRHILNFKPIENSADETGPISHEDILELMNEPIESY